MGQTGMKYLVLSVVFALSGALSTACGGGDKPPPLGGNTPGASGGSGGSSGHAGSAGKLSEFDAGEDGGGRDGAGGTGTNAGDAGVLAPFVTIVSPDPASDPNVDPIIQSVKGNNIVTMRCDAVPGSGAMGKTVDASAVTLEMLDASGTVVDSKPGGQSQTNKNEFSHDFVFTSLKSGKVSFRCRAHYVGLPQEASATIASLVDNGPTITRIQPLADSAHPLTQPVPVEFAVDPAPLASGDDGAAVTDVELQINGVTVCGGASAPACPIVSGHYTLSVNLADTATFTTPPNGSIPISITGTNRRKIARTDTYHFVVDSTGPVINITLPVASDIIGGSTLLQFTIDDPGSGVAINTLSVTLNKDVHPYMMNGLWSITGNAYTFKLDATTVTDATFQVTVIIDVQDIAGNESKKQVSYYIDTSPPIVDLDPPPLQEVKLVNNQYVCSLPFDPLGDVPANDWTNPSQAIKDVTFLRVLAWDQANQTLDINSPVLTHFRGVDQGSVTIYVQGDVSKGVLVKNAKNGTVCDEVDKTLPILTTYPIPPSGSSDFEPSQVSPIPGYCVAGTENLPPYLCPAQPDLLRVIQHEQSGGNVEPVIYSLAPSKGECNSQIQLASLPGVSRSGWVCLAARAVDGVGNVGVSAPLRLCLANPNDPLPDCAKPMSSTPPSCTNDCVAPAHFFFDPNNPPTHRSHIRLPQ